MTNKAPRAPGSVRIIAGTLRGSKLPVADMAGLRPTPDRVRETLFNWLVPHLDGARCLDLYAGSGALGIECASRGAARVTMVERDRTLAASLRANLDRLRVVDAEVVEDDALRFLGGTPRPFDIAFVDPPFTANAWAAACAALETNGWLAARAHVYVESPRQGDAVVVPPNWQSWRDATAGDVRYALYRRVAASPATSP